jgi:hypothetical protein
MTRSVVGIILMAVVVALGSGLCQRAQAQDFPYMVPQAPEFDDRGTPVQSSDGESSAPRSHLRRGNYPQAGEVRSEPENRVDYRSVRQYTPRTGPRSAAMPPITGQSELSSPPQAHYPTPASTRPQQRQTARNQPPQQPGASPGGPPGQLDCSQFPQVIAQAASEGEMQLAAREYLTCLLRTGWNQDMARKHVIATIETAYKLAR